MLPPASEVEYWSWHFTISVTDSFGFSSSKPLRIGKPAVLAAGVMATDFKINETTPVDTPELFYDSGLTNILTLNSGQTMVIDFGQPVKARNVHFAAPGNNRGMLHADVAGQWVPLAALGNSISTAHNAISSFTEFRSQRFMFSPVTSSVTIRELAIGY